MTPTSKKDNASSIRPLSPPPPPPTLSDDGKSIHVKSMLYAYVTILYAIEKEHDDDDIFKRPFDIKESNKENYPPPPTPQRAPIQVQFGNTNAPTIGSEIRASRDHEKDIHDMYGWHAHLIDTRGTLHCAWKDRYRWIKRSVWSGITATTMQICYQMCQNQQCRQISYWWIQRWDKITSQTQQQWSYRLPISTWNQERRADYLYGKRIAKGVLNHGKWEIDPFEGAWTRIDWFCAFAGEAQGSASQLSFPTLLLAAGKVYWCLLKE